MSENHSQTAETAFPYRIVKKITGFLFKAVGKGCTFFVKKIAISENACKTAPFSTGRRAIQVADSGSPGGPAKGSRAGFRLARMLLPQTIAMSAEFESTMTSGRYMMAALRQPVAKPRGLSRAPSFFVLVFCVKVFTNRWVPTVARSGAERKDQYAELCDPGQM